MSTTATRVGLVEACDDRDLFGFPLWPRQRELLAAVEEGSRLHLWALGRRSGKTTLQAIVGLWSCLLRPDLLEHLRPGEQGYAVGIATNLRQARLLVHAATSIVQRSPLLGELVETVTEDEITFANGTAFTAFPCSSRGGRGWPVFCLSMDEAAHFMTETEGPQVADRVFAAMVPSTAQFGDLARVIVSSTPYGTGGLFADLFQRATSGELEDAVAQQASTSEVNPTIPAETLEQEQRRDPEGFRSEYLAEFVGGGGSFLDPAVVDAAVVERGELSPHEGFHWVAGLDPAFSSDPFGLAIVGIKRGDALREGLDPQRLVLAYARAWTPSKAKARSLDEARVQEDAVLDEVAEVCLRYRATVVIDQFRAAGVADYLRRKGLAVRVEPMTATSKTAIFTELRARLNQRALELYPEPTLLAELKRLRTKYTAGQASVVNPRVGGSHGDLAQALALAVAEHRSSLTSGGETFPIVGGDSTFSEDDFGEPIRYDMSL